MRKHFSQLLFLSLVSLIFSASPLFVWAQADDLMLVEYVDFNPGSGVGVKIYNPTNASINLGNYVLEVYNNGAVSPNGSYSLSGTIASKGTIITGNSPYCGSDCPASCNVSNSNSGVNGNDVVVLRSGGNIIDMIGLLGYDPGTAGWRVDNVSNALKWHLVTRKSDNCTRYTSTSGSGANSWPQSSSTNVTGWTVSGYSCITQGFTLNIPTANPKINIPAADTTVCQGTPINFVANGKYRYLRRNSSGEAVISALDSALQINFTKIGIDTIIVQATSCGVIVEDTLIVNVSTPFTFNIGADTSICGNVNLVLDPKIAGAQYTWQDNSTQPTFAAKDTGLYFVAINKNNCIFKDSIRIDPKTASTFNFGPDTTLCQGDSIILSHTCAGCTYLWSDNSNNNSLKVKTNGTYWLHTDDGVCKSADTIMVTFVAPPLLDLGKDSTLCLGDSVILNSPANVSRLWEDMSTDSSRTLKATGTYALQISAGSCKNNDTIVLTFKTPPQVNFGAPDTTLCAGDSIVLNSPANVSRLWDDMRTDSSHTIKTAGLYWLQVTDGVCKAADTILVKFNPKPALNFGKDSSLCVGDSIVLTSPSNVTRLWEDNSTVSTRTLKNTGTYWLKITDNNACTNADTINITFSPQPIFSLGPDSVLCNNSTIALQIPAGLAGQKVWSTGATATTITVASPNVYWAKVTQNNCSYTDSITILTPPTYTKKLKDTTLCSGTTGFLDATTAGAASYLWDDGSSLPSRSISTQGNYKVTLTISGCNYFDSASIQVNTIPNSPNIADTTVCEDATLLLDGTTNADTYSWNTGETTPLLSIDSGGIYIVTATNKCGSVSDTAIITVDLCAPPYIPNVFSPNGDSINDYFYIDFKNAYNFEVEIFNRWGERVFQSKDPKFAWDGRFKGELVPAGVYFYIVVSKIGIGKTFNAKGSLTIFR